MLDTNQPDPHPTSVLDIDPADVLTERVVNLLTPAFLDPAKGDEDLARAAAFKALCDYYDHTPGDLLSIGQTILLGLATIEAAGRSLAPGVSDATFLRLTGRANALARSEARARKAMLDYCIPRPQQKLPDWSPTPNRSFPEQPEAEAAPPPQPAAKDLTISNSTDHPPHQTALTARPAGTAPHSTKYARALGDVSHGVMIGTQPANVDIPPEFRAMIAAAGLDWAVNDRAKPALAAS